MTVVKARFANDFSIIVEHYGCTEDEIELMRAASRADLVNAERSFGLLADEIRPARYINERIRAACALERHPQPAVGKCLTPAVVEAPPPFSERLTGPPECSTASATTPAAPGIEPVPVFDNPELPF